MNKISNNLNHKIIYIIENIKGVYTPNTEKPIICLKNATIIVQSKAIKTIAKIFTSTPAAISWFTKYDNGK